MTVGAGPRSRICCRAVLLDAGGVLVLPHRDLVCAALADTGLAIPPSAVGRAHYKTVRRLDAATAETRSPGYFPVFCEAIGVPRADREAAVGALRALADRARSGKVLWSEPAAHAVGTIGALRRVGIRVVVVTNSDGHAAENLRAAGVCQIGAGPGAQVDDVIDSALVGSAKPDRLIFEIAVDRAGADPASIVHVGDMVTADVIGARSAGVTPIHLDPYRRCRATDHRHVRSLAGIWQHVAPWRP